jgi:hypothetical protein
MTDKNKQIQVILRTPDEARRFGRGFYQVEEDCLYVPLHPARAFYSYVDSDHVQLDIDQAGRLIFISVTFPRRHWQVCRTLTPPSIEGEADIRILNFRENLLRSRLETDADRSILKIAYDRSDQPTTSYAVAEHVSCEIAADGSLAAIWITRIEDDRGARQMATWRKQADESGGEHVVTFSPYRRIQISSGE